MNFLANPTDLSPPGVGASSPGINVPITPVPQVSLLCTLWGRRESRGGTWIFFLIHCYSSLVSESLGASVFQNERALSVLSDSQSPLHPAPLPEEGLPRSLSGLFGSSRRNFLDYV